MDYFDYFSFKEYKDYFDYQDRPTTDDQLISIDEDFFESFDDFQQANWEEL